MPGVQPRRPWGLRGCKKPGKHSKITMDIYAKVKYNKPKELSSVVNKAFAPKKGATPNKMRNG